MAVKKAVVKKVARKAIPKKVSVKSVTDRSIATISSPVATVADIIAQTFISENVLLPSVVSSKPRVNSFSREIPNLSQPVFTGRKIVLLNPEVSTSQILKQANTMSLKMASVKDFTNKKTSLVSDALEQADGIVFD